MADFLKDYEPVEDRLRAFWSEHPDGRIETVMVGETDGRFVVQAWAYRTEDGKPASSGLAMERETDRGVNATSALENCETSAIGRALANLGYAAKGKRPSREEMSKASSVAPPADAGSARVRSPRPTEDSPSAPSPTGQKTSPGEAGGADTGPGEGPSLPSPGFPVEKCDHRYPSGAPAKVIKGGREICKKCGVPWVTAVEGTTEDLGPA